MHLHEAGGGAGEGAAAVGDPQGQLVLAGRELAGAGEAVDDPDQGGEVAVGVVGGVQAAGGVGVARERAGDEAGAEMMAPWSIIRFPSRASS